MGSYFGSELCPVDIDMDGTTDFLLVAAPFYHVHGQEGRVYVYRVNQQVGEPPPLQACGAVAASLGHRQWRLEPPWPCLAPEGGDGGGQPGGQRVPSLRWPTFSFSPSPHLTGGDNSSSSSTVLSHPLL